MDTIATIVVRLGSQKAHLPITQRKGPGRRVIPAVDLLLGKTAKP